MNLIIHPAQVTPGAFQSFVNQTAVVIKNIHQCVPGFIIRAHLTNAVPTVGCHAESIAGIGRKRPQLTLIERTIRLSLMKQCTQVGLRLIGRKVVLSRDRLAAGVWVYRDFVTGDIPE